MPEGDIQGQNDTQQRNGTYDEQYSETIRAFTEFLDNDVSNLIYPIFASDRVKLLVTSQTVPSVEPSFSNHFTSTEPTNTRKASEK
jgi:hypothetical protein